MKSLQTLHIIIVWYNEEKNIDKLCQSLEYIANCKDISVHIIYCDQSSTDQSLEYLKQYSYLQVRHHPQYGLWEISRMKIHDEEVKDHEWLLFLDADEQLTQAVSNEIISIIQSDHYDIWWMRFDLLFMWVKLSTAKQPRLFKKWSTKLQSIPHNHFIQLSDRQITLTNKMINYDLKLHGQEVVVMLEKLNRYTEKEIERYDSVSYLQLIYQMFIKPIIRFFGFGLWWWYFFKGFPWRICAFHNAAYEFFKWAKLYARFYYNK